MNAAPRLQESPAPLHRRTTLARVLTSIAIAAGAVVPAHAQYSVRRDIREPAAQPWEGYLIGRFIFSPSVFFSAAYDTNVFRVEDGFDPDGPTRRLPLPPNAPPGQTREVVGTIPPNRPRGDALMTGRARLGLKLPFSHSFFSFVWSPQYANYASLDRPRKSTQSATLEGKLNFSNGATIRVVDDYVDGFFETHGLDAASRGFQLTATPYRRNTARLEYDWAFAGEWGVAGSLERVSFVYDPTQVTDLRNTTSGVDASESRQFDFYDYDADTVETRAYRSFSRIEVYASLLAGRSNQDRSKYNDSRIRGAGCDHPPDQDTSIEATICPDLRAQIDSESIRQIDGGFGIKGQLSPLTGADLRVGYSTWTFRRGGNEPFSGISIEGTLDHVFNRTTAGHARLLREASQASGQATGYYVLEQVSVWFDRKFTMRLTGATGFNMYYRDYPGSESVVEVRMPDGRLVNNTKKSAAFTLVDYSAFAELRYRPGRGSRPGPFLVVVNYSPQVSRSTLPGLDVNDHRVLTYVQYGWF